MVVSVIFSLKCIPQQLLGTLEEESRTAALKPRVMKKFSETQKAERALASTKSSKKKPALTSASNEGEEEGEEEGEGEPNLLSAEGKENGGDSMNASPRNKTLLSKLGTRLRGGGRGKKTNSSTTSSKKTKE